MRDVTRLDTRRDLVNTVYELLLATVASDCLSEKTDIPGFLSLAGLPGACDAFSLANSALPRCYSTPEKLLPQPVSREITMKCEGRNFVRVLGSWWFRKSGNTR